VAMDARRVGEGRTATHPHPPCPACGVDDALRRRWRYRYLPPWPLRWLTVFVHHHVAQVYVCAMCRAVVSLRVVQGRGHARGSHPRPRR